MTELRELAEFIARLRWERVPEGVRSSVRNVIFDTVGVGIGACDNPQNLNLVKTFRDVEPDAHAVRVWGQKGGYSLFTAIYLNGCEGHTLEMDDVHTGSKVHIGTALIPAVWSVAELMKKSGRELMLATLCGYEAAARVGMALGVSAHRNLGWHATATAGIIGAAAATAKLLDLNVDQIVSAMGMAGEIAGGTWAFLGDGASCKVMNPAMAAVNGARCAFNAKAGMTGPEHVLTAEDGGMLAAMSDDYDVSRISAGLGTVWEVQHMDNKPYPCCRSTHCAIDGALELREKHAIEPGEIEKVEVYTYLIGNKQCGMSAPSKQPRIPVEAKFSTPYTVALAFLYGKVGLQEFEQSCIERREVRELLGRVTVSTDEELTSKYPEHWGCRLRVFLKNGEMHETLVPDASGSVENPLNERQMQQKIRGILERVKEKEECEDIIRRLLEIESWEEVRAIG